MPVSVKLAARSPLSQFVDPQTHLVVTKEAQSVDEALLGSATRARLDVVIDEAPEAAPETQDKRRPRAVETQKE